ncbi:cryptochrome/photolyase family protein [Arenicella xantha]|uniref:Deoxyribodipyrimidine photolyase-related protein n=1 Tax=Arenicella xantha TaxID=644221 RepID=A0A395JML3_9GAMM|nr:cryptochrome/photolyase family protein [Arenicella xantha]RBP51665.1 deoxyribodipyrimidine photolyase-related protein [Arenicella xantha]
MTTKTLRLILGDQLNASHSWYREVDDSVIYVLAELHQEQQYVKHHVQKIVAFFLSMQRFAEALRQAGHQVLLLDLDDTAEFVDLPALLAELCKRHHIDCLEYQRPDEYRLVEQMRSLDVPVASINEVDTEHFYLPFDEIDDYFSADTAVRMETFYRKMRARFDVLMDDAEPLGGQWNFDADNRNKLKQSDLADIPAALLFESNIQPILSRLERHNIEYFGVIDNGLSWPTSRQEARQLLAFFCAHCLPKFGRFQDAMTAKSDSAWSLYHSRLSFALNAKIIDPKTVITKAIEAHRARPDEIDLAQIEGFVRQILGWREFVRGIYWVNMPTYSERNALEASNALPAYFWNGETKMRCMQFSLGQSLEHAYAHHIQRLMVIGNFCLLTGMHPDAVDAWYLGVYIDAIEWVEMPNTRGMCQFSDGGLVASKPYAASGSYINRMSDYCGDCHYAVKKKVGEDACPFNSLYWHFMHRHRDRFGNNPRIGMVYRNLDKMDEALRAETLERAEVLMADLDSL